MSGEEKKVALIAALTELRGRHQPAASTICRKCFQPGNSCHPCSAFGSATFASHLRIITRRDFVCTDCLRSKDICQMPRNSLQGHRWYMFPTEEAKWLRLNFLVAWQQVGVSNEQVWQSLTTEQQRQKQSLVEDMVNSGAEEIALALGLHITVSFRPFPRRANRN